MLLTAWLDLPDMGQLEVVEYFAGRARISKMCSRLGLRTGSFDITYGKAGINWSTRNGLPKRSAFDMNSDAGFLFLVLGVLIVEGLRMFSYYFRIKEIISDVRSSKVGYPDDFIQHLGESFRNVCASM